MEHKLVRNIISEKLSDNRNQKRVTPYFTIGTCLLCINIMYINYVLFKQY